VVPDLGRVVEDRAGAGLPDDVFQSGVLELPAGRELVELLDVGGVVLAVVELERLRRDVRGQGGLG